MTAITYVAKRNIHQTGVGFITQTDIGADTTGSPEVSVFNSNGSPSTDLSVFTNGYWVYVTGFTNTENNGWHQIEGTPSNVSLPIYEFYGALVTEAAGNEITIAEYYRGYNQSYNLETNSRIVTMPSDEGVRTESVSLNGQRETLFFRFSERYSVQSGILTAAEFGQWREFFASVMGGEAFTLDPYGTISAPDNPLTVYLNGNPSYSRVGNAAEYIVNFTVDVAP
jgi:hypothetical protein